MSVEKLNQPESRSEQVLSKEERLERGRNELADIIETMPVPEGTPEKFIRVAQLEAVEHAVDPQKQFYTMKAANIELNTTFDDMRHGDFVEWQKFKMMKKMGEVANDNQRPEAEVA